MVEASFGSTKLEQVDSYRVSAYFKTGSGFSDCFWIYLWDRMAANITPEEGIDVGPKGKPRTDTLTIVGDGRQYTFENVILKYAMSGATRKERFRFLALQYAAKVIDGKTSPVTLTNQSPDRLDIGELGDDYKYSVGEGEMEHLLGMNARVSANEQTIVKLTTLRNDANCFLEKFLTANVEQRPPDVMTEFQITTTQKTFDISRQTLQGVYIEESYGECRGMPFPDMADWLPSSEKLVRDLVKIDAPNHLDGELLMHDGGVAGGDSLKRTETVETAFLLFTPGHYRDLKLK